MKGAQKGEIMETQAKTQKKGTTIFIISIFLCTASIICVFFFMKRLPVWVRVLLQGANIGFLLGSWITYFLGLKTYLKLIFTFIAMLAFFVGGYVILELLGVFEKLYNIELLKNFILSAGGWGMFVFVLVQIIQVVFLPIPAIIVNLVGVALYGPTIAFLLGTLGVFIGSIICFWMGRTFGSKLVEWIAGDEALKYRRLLSNKGKYILILMLLFPMFPDDMLCMVAGVTTMSWRYFLTVVLLTRPIMIAAMCYMGTGDIIPFSGWGILIWILIFVLMAIVFYFANKYKEQIMQWFTKTFKKKKVRSRSMRKNRFRD